MLLNVFNNYFWSLYALYLEKVGDFEDEKSLPPMKLTRSTNVHLTTEPAIS